MTDYAPEVISVNGVVATARTAAAGDKLTDPGEHRTLRVINGGGAPITVTIASPGSTSYGEALPTKVITITNGAANAKNIPIRADYGVVSDARKVALTWSATTSVTFEYTRST